MVLCDACGLHEAKLAVKARPTEVYCSEYCCSLVYEEQEDVGISAAKAREILHHGTVHGHPLTARQRRYMGWAKRHRK